ncbi:MAG: pitrilysin family protein [Cytophagales bacterium]|nr:pitrilysin family protein [Cytophagales bacterium]
MIKFEEFRLDNGLQVIVHEDSNSMQVCLNILYHVGARNENPERTGFAHLFEHLMFGGSKNIPSFDEPLQAVGGDNNAFTGNDFTNYYTTIPSTNVETAFWLESDRMLSLSFDPEVLEVQRSVVIEEFKERYLNQPYGDVWMKLRPEAYKVHPYRWATIGREISHIEKATMDDVKDFFGKFYGPNNATLVLAGGITLKEAKRLSEKWFGPIPAIKVGNKDIPQEPRQEKHRLVEVTADVPTKALYKSFHMPGRSEKKYHTADLLSDLLGRGKSSPLYRELVNDQRMFHSISAYVVGSADPGLLMIEGKLKDDTTFEAAEEGINKVLTSIRSGEVDEESVDRIKSQAEASIAFGEVELLNRAVGLAFSDFLGDPNLINQELSIVQDVSKKDLLDMANDILLEDNTTTLHYHKAN